MTAAIMLAAAICNAEVCPERDNDFCWENDKFGPTRAFSTTIRWARPRVQEAELHRLGRHNVGEGGGADDPRGVDRGRARLQGGSCEGFQITNERK